MGEFELLDVILNIILLAALIGVAVWLFRNRGTQPSWDEEEIRSPRGARTSYYVFFAMGLLFTAMGVSDGKFSTTVMGLALTAWSGWRWLRLRKRRSTPSDAEGTLRAE